MPKYVVVFTVPNTNVKVIATKEFDDIGIVHRNEKGELVLDNTRFDDRPFDMKDKVDDVTYLQLNEQDRQIQLGVSFESTAAYYIFKRLALQDWNVDYSGLNLL